MTSAINTPACAASAKVGANHVTLLSRIDNAILGLRNLLQARQPGSRQKIDPWSTAVSQVQHLDHHVLKDIGAPTWVIDEIDRRQRGLDTLNSTWKW